MKTRFTLFAFLLLCLTGLNAQTGFFGGSGGPFKPQSPLFGKDIVINDQPTQNQRTMAICSAFNGWLFSVNSYINSTYNFPAFTILKSIDNGITWTVLTDNFWIAEDYYFTSMDIVAIGDSVSNLKVNIAGVLKTQSYEMGDALGFRFNGLTGEFENQFFGEGTVYDLALAPNYSYPSAPSTFSVLFSKTDYNKDTIIFKTSNNGGVLLNVRKIVAFSSHRYDKVSLGYGRSFSWNKGRYFAAWEEKDDFTSTTGRIYTSHNDTNYNSAFTTPVQLDALDPSETNLCRNPVIACQYNNTDNDSANLTEVVLFEKYKPAGGDYDVTGFYNLQATTTSHFRPLNIATASNKEVQPDICYNPFNSKFMVTYFDLTAKKLPLVTNDVNLSNPDSWNVISQGYNDNSNLVAPNPKVNVNFGNQDGMNAWISEGTGGNGIALFDAPYSTYTGVSGNSIGTSAKLIGSYPNPCTNSIKIAFELKNAGKVIIEIMSIMGQPLGSVTDQNYPAGKQVVQYNVSNLLDGNYLYKLRSGDFTATGKFTVIR